MAITKDDDMPAPDPIHPGEHLAGFLEELNVTPYRLAKTIGVHQVRVSEMIHGRRSITADIALRLGRACDMTPEYWLNLQRMYDLDVARQSTDIDAITPLIAAATEAEIRTG